MTGRKNCRGCGSQMSWESCEVWATSALITGMHGQDGSYLSELLLEKGCKVFYDLGKPGTEC